MSKCQIAIGRSIDLISILFPNSPLCQVAMQAISTNQPDPSRRLLLGILHTMYIYIYLTGDLCSLKSTKNSVDLHYTLLAYFRRQTHFTSSDPHHDISRHIFVHILSYILYSDILPTFLSDTYSDIYSDILFVFVSHIFWPSI